MLRSSHCGAMGWVASWDHWDAGLIPGATQWIGDPALLQLWLKSQLQLGCDPWPRNSICCGVVKKRKKKMFDTYCQIIFNKYYNQQDRRQVNKGIFKILDIVKFFFFFFQLKSKNITRSLVFINFFLNKCLSDFNQSQFNVIKGTKLI